MRLVGFVVSLLNRPTALLLHDAGSFVLVQLEGTLHEMKD